MTIDDLRKLISYDPETGGFTRLVILNPRAKGGWFDAKGYLHIGVGGKRFSAHRLAWALHYGEWPKGLIDHANGVPDDNRIANLRLANRAQNAFNSKIRVHSAHGRKGVSRAGGCWIARIVVDGTRKYLGTYPTMEDAAEAYRAASVKFHGEFSPFVTGVA